MNEEYKLYNAYPYKDLIEKFYSDYLSDSENRKRLKYFSAQYYNDLNFSTKLNEWNEIVKVISNNGTAINGLIDCSINKYISKAYDLRIINFSTPVYSFGKLLKYYIDMLFYEYNLNKIEFMAFCGNPILPTYEKYIKKYNGRFIGLLSDYTKDYTGKYMDALLFELMRDDYIKADNRRKKCHIINLSMMK